MGCGRSSLRTKPAPTDDARCVDVVVLTLDGSATIYNIMSYDSVAMLKDAISKKQGTPAGLQLLRIIDSEQLLVDAQLIRALLDNDYIVKGGLHPKTLTITLLLVVDRLPGFKWECYANGTISSDRLTVTSTVESKRWDLKPLAIAGPMISEGSSFLELEIEVDNVHSCMMIGVVRRCLHTAFDMTICHTLGMDAYCLSSSVGGLNGNGNGNRDVHRDACCHGKLDNGDRIAMWLDLSRKRLVFFRNGLEYGPGFNTVEGPVSFYIESSSVTGSGKGFPAVATIVSHDRLPDWLLAWKSNKWLHRLRRNKQAHPPPRRLISL